LRPENHVEILQPGVMVARIVKRVEHNPPGQADHDFEGWVRVCEQALALEQECRRGM
jgi:hypothetical protein